MLDQNAGRGGVRAAEDRARIEFETFGSAVAISGNVAIVGAIYDSGPPGRAYVFTMDASGGTQQAMLTPSESSGFDSFGAAVAIDGNYARRRRTGRGRTEN